MVSELLDQANGPPQIRGGGDQGGSGGLGRRVLRAPRHRLHGSASAGRGLPRRPLRHPGHRREPVPGRRPSTPRRNWSAARVTTLEDSSGPRSVELARKSAACSASTWRRCAAPGGIHSDDDNDDLPPSPTALSYAVADGMILDLGDKQSLLAAENTDERLTLELEYSAPGGRHGQGVRDAPRRRTPPGPVQHELKQRELKQRERTQRELPAKSGRPVSAARRRTLVKYRPGSATPTGAARSVRPRPTPPRRPATPRRRARHCRSADARSP